jgi:hypothetical protein
MSFDASEDFAFAKEAGVGCRYLRRDCRCAIHGELVERGLRGCSLYDCYGAGPRVTRAFAGVHGADRERDEAFRILREVHELLWLLTEAAKLCPAADALGAQLELAIEALDAIAQGSAAELFEADLRPHRAAARALLRRVGDALGGRRQAARALAVLGGRRAARC